MFDARRFGAYLSKKRKESDMTQSELAERLNLTRQAVSKYEMGDSFPDVSVLIRIAEVFGISLDELIGSGSPTVAETQFLNTMVDGDGKGASMEADDFVNIAPLIKPSTLDELQERLNIRGIDISHVVELVQYMNDDNVSRLLRSAAYETLDEGMIEKLIPFLNDESKETILERIIEGEIDWRLLEAMLPYIEDMSRQLEAAVIDGALPKEVLDMMNEYQIEKNQRRTR